MDTTENSDMHDSSFKKSTLSFVSQMILRFLAIVTTLVATWLILTSREKVVIFGMTADASYKYSSAYRFFAYANLIAFISSVLSLLVTIIIGNTAFNPNKYFYLFLHDLILTVLLMAGCAAATAIGFVGTYGNGHIGWMKICDNFGKFCNRVTLSIGFSYVCVGIYFLLAIVSANISRHCCTNNGIN
ncbi:hypothetical protein LIER_03910 [Lithospermum erythrorhizon]|uniref:CASP-like protein n=1 Tax=Lithospermum erythrorhizon TaxID=34254 RepID=A0AAV3NV08_LITER